MRSPLLDRLLRLALSVPGRLADWIDGRAVLPDGPGPLEVWPQVRATALHPEAHLALEPGLHYVAGPRYLFGVQIRRRTAFAIGGLNAPDAQRLEALEHLRDAFTDHGVRRTLLFPLRPAERAVAHQAGFRTLQVGVEGWLDLNDGLFEGRAGAQVRQQRRRAERRGITVAEIRTGEERPALEALYATWLRARRPSWRMRLLVGSPGFDHPFDRRTFIARGPGRIEAFCTVLPGGLGRSGLDVMCRHPDAPPGVMELLIHAVATTLRDEGQAALSLGPCPMAGVPVEAPMRPLKALFKALYGSWWGNQLFGFRNLHRFKAKFRPRWVPVYLAATPRLGPMTLYRGCRMWGLY